MLELRIDEAGYDTRRLDTLSGLTVPLKPGRLTLITGPNGSGKSTILQILVGVHEMSGGWSRYNREDLERWPPLQKLVFVPQDAQDFFLFPTPASDLLHLAQRHAHAIEAALKDLRDRLAGGELDGYDVRAISTFSEGERRLIALAVGFASLPNLVVLDEPLASLDTIKSLLVETWIRAYLDRGGILVAAEHSGGRLLRWPNASVISLEPTKHNAMPDLGPRLSPFIAVSQPSRIIQFNGKAAVRSHRNLWGGTPWRRSIGTFRPSPGQIVWIRGKNGSGKTALMRTLGGVRTPAGGRVLFAGRDISHRPLRFHRSRILDEHFIQVPQRTTQQIQSLTVGELSFLYLGASGQASPVLSHIDSTIPDASGRALNSLSRGEAKFIELMLTLLASKSVFLLDEPFTHLDNYYSAAIVDLLRQRVSQDATVVIVEHQLPASLPVAQIMDLESDPHQT